MWWFLQVTLEKKPKGEEQIIRQSGRQPSYSGTAEEKSILAPHSNLQIQAPNKAAAEKEGGSHGQGQRAPSSLTATYSPPSPPDPSSTPSTPSSSTAMVTLIPCGIFWRFCPFLVVVLWICVLQGWFGRGTSSSMGSLRQWSCCGRWYAAFGFVSIRRIALFYSAGLYVERPSICYFLKFCAWSY